MSFCRFKTVKTDNSDTCRFYISREGLSGFPFSPFRFPFYKGALEDEQEEQ